jgi:acetyl-CoA synthetase
LEVCKTRGAIFAAESVIVGYPLDIKGSAFYGYVTLKGEGLSQNEDELRTEINQLIADLIGPNSKLDMIQFTNGLPKTRSGKIMRRILRKITCVEVDDLGDISPLLNP